MCKSVPDAIRHEYLESECTFDGLWIPVESESVTKLVISSQFKNCFSLNFEVLGDAFATIIRKPVEAWKISFFMHNQITLIHAIESRDS
jgi:hypothetical protein